MPSWKTICNWTGLIFLLFLGIPIKINSPDSVDIKQQFDSFIIHFNKSYANGSEEYNRRYKIFKDSVARINQLNAARKDNHTAIYGVTRFSDLTEEEFLANLDTVKRLSKNHQRKVKTDHNLTILESINPKYYDQNPMTRLRAEMDKLGLPLKLDWRDQGVISGVEDQGLCGACWAYSTVQVAEAMSAMKTGNLSTLSVQQMIDCATNGNFGCKGGDICSLLLWLTTYNVTIHRADEYPLTKKTDTCRSVVTNTTGVRIKDFTCGSLLGKEDSIVKWLAITGPVAVAVNGLSWQNYLGGVIQFHCPEDAMSLNHAVQLVGYDLTANIPYYIAKNSWGEKFGLDGYLHLTIGENICGLANEVSMLHVF